MCGSATKFLHRHLGEMCSVYLYLIHCTSKSRNCVNLISLLFIVAVVELSKRSGHNITMGKNSSKSSGVYMKAS